MITGWPETNPFGVSTVPIVALFVFEVCVTIALQT